MTIKQKLDANLCAEVRDKETGDWDECFFSLWEEGEELWYCKLHERLSDKRDPLNCNKDPCIAYRTANCKKLFNTINVELTSV